VTNSVVSQGAAFVATAAALRRYAHAG
jgi:hypothetical protein